MTSSHADEVMRGFMSGLLHRSRRSAGLAGEVLAVQRSLHAVAQGGRQGFWPARNGLRANADQSGRRGDSPAE